MDFISTVSGLQAAKEPGSEGDSLHTPPAAGGGGDFYTGSVGMAGRNASCLEPAQSTSTLLCDVDSSAPAVSAGRQQNADSSNEGRTQSMEQKERDGGGSLTGALCFPKDWFPGDSVRK